jgi:hypothetical protein
VSRLPTATRLAARPRGAAQRLGHAVVFKPEPPERPALPEDKRFYPPPYFGPSGWVALDFTAAPVGWVEVAELMESSYRQVALRRMLKALDRDG